MGNLNSHGAKAIKASKEMNNYNSNNSGQSFEKKDIWFKWDGKDERTIRLVGDFKWNRHHWIGKSKFAGKNDVDLFEEDAFKGDNKLPNQIVCGNWDMSTESVSDNGCAVCELLKKTENCLKKYGKDLDEQQKQNFKDIITKCKPKDNYYFLCIDRDNPYITEGEKGFKIIQMPLTLLTAITELSSKLTEIDLTSDEDGIDIVIKKTPPASGKGRTEYSVTPVFSGLTIKKTPLTEEELKWDRLDLSKMLGKAYDNDVLKECFTEEMNDILNDSDEDAEDGMPF